MARVPPDQFGFCGPSYTAISPVVDAQSSVNLYPEAGYKTSKTGIALIGRPGLTLVSTLPTSPVNELWIGSNRMFSAAGGHVYEVNNSGGVITDYGPGLTGGPQPIPMIANANGQQLLCCDPVAGKIFNVNPATHTLDLVFNGKALEWLDGFFVAIASGASLVGSTPNQVNVSALLNGVSWSATDYVFRTGAADLITQVAVLNGMLWIFGEQTIEIWYNAGSPNFPFARVNGGQINLGLLAPPSVVKFQNALMWLGASDNGGARVYLARGMAAAAVSTPAIEQVMANVPTPSLRYQARAYGYQEAGHSFYCLKFVNGFGVPEKELVYDLDMNLWHERKYDPFTGPWPQCFGSISSAGWGFGPNYVGDSMTGKLFIQDVKTANDAGIGITYTRRAPHLSDGNQVSFHTRFELDGDFGALFPTLDWSDDGGRTWGGRTRALQQAAAPSGDVSPRFRRFFANQLGRSRDRVYELKVAAPGASTDPLRIANAYLDIEGGTA